MMKRLAKNVIKSILRIFPTYRVGYTTQSKLKTLEKEQTNEFKKINKLLNEQKGLFDNHNQTLNNKIDEVEKRLTYIKKKIDEQNNKNNTQIQNLKLLMKRNENLFFERLSDNTPNYILSYVLTYKPEVLKNINSDSICIDIGANKGDITSVFLRLGAKVYAYEPDINMYNFMRYRFSEALENGSLKLFHKAVWTKNKTLKLYNFKEYKNNNVFMDNSSEHSSLIEEKQTAKKYQIDKEKYQKVECIDIVDLISGFKSEIYLMKIDIEGAEYEVLSRIINKGLTNKINHVFAELHAHMIPELEEKENKLLELIKKEDINNIHTDWH